MATRGYHIFHISFPFYFRLQLINKTYTTSTSHDGTKKTDQVRIRIASGAKSVENTENMCKGQLSDRDDEKTSPGEQRSFSQGQ